MLIAIIVVIVITVLVIHFLRPYVNSKRESMIYEMVNNVTDILGPMCYADFGTLLGAYRDGGVIRDDMDGDLAILRKDEEKAFELLSAELNPFKYKLVRDPLKLKVWIRGTMVGCDIGIYDVKEGSLRRQKFVIPYYKVFPLKTIMWGSHAINIPNDPEWYLEYEFGQTWKIPRAGDKGREGGNKYHSALSEFVYRLGATVVGIPLLFNKDFHSIKK